MLGNITEDLALRCGDVIGGLMNATFGNVVELLMSVVFIWQSRQKPSLNDIVAATLLGSILSNLVLVLGMCFFFGGLYHPEQFFNVSASKANNALLFMSCIAVVLPSIRLGLRGRVSQPVIDRGFLGGVGLALCHAGYMMFGDSTV